MHDSWREPFNNRDGLGGKEKMQREKAVCSMHEQEELDKREERAREKQREEDDAHKDA